MSGKANLSERDSNSSAVTVVDNTPNFQQQDTSMKHYARVCRTRARFVSSNKTVQDMVIDAASRHKEIGIQRLLSLETYQQVSSQPLKKLHAKLVAFGGQRIRSLGKLPSCANINTPMHLKLSAV